MRTELGTFSLDVAKRILDRLYDRNFNRTNLASSSRINYNTLIRYLGILSTLGWIRMSEQGMVSITPFGQEARKRLHNLESNESGKGTGNTSLTEFYSKGAGLVNDSTETQNPFTRYRGCRNKIVQQPATTRDANKQSRMHNVMIVDDEPEVGLTYRMFLKSTGRYNTEVFTEPSLALKNFAGEPDYYDLAILDIRMQGINGLRLYQSMNAMNPECRFLFVSALDVADELLSIFPGIGPHDVIRKPISKDAFIKVVDSHFMGN